MDDQAFKTFIASESQKMKTLIATLPTPAK
jgi:hypothetical protein